MARYFCFHFKGCFPPGDDSQRYTRLIVAVGYFVFCAQDYSPASRWISQSLGCCLPRRCFASMVYRVLWLSRGELRQTLIGGTGSSALYLLWAHTTLQCGNLIIPNLLWQGQQHRAPGYHLSSQQIGSRYTRQTDGSSSCWGPGWSKAAASCLHDWSAEEWRGGLVIKGREEGDDSNSSH